MRRRNLTVLKRLIALTSCGFLLMQPITQAASAVTVAEDAKMAAARMRDEAKAIADYHKSMEYLRLAELYVVAAGENLTAAQKDKAAAKEALADAKIWRSEANEWLYQAEFTVKQLQETIYAMGSEASLREEVNALRADSSQINEEIGRLNGQKNSVLADWQAKIDSKSSQLSQRILEEINYDEHRLDEAEALVQAKLTPDEDKMADAESACDAKIEAAEELKAAAEEKLAEAEDKLNDFLSLQAELTIALADKGEAGKNFTEASANLAEAKSYGQETEENVILAAGDLADSLQDMAEAKKSLQPVEESRYFQGKMRYYSWQDNEGRKGSQLYQPYQFYLKQDDMEYGVQTAYQISDNESLAEGRMAGFTDTTVSIAKTVLDKAYTFVYGLDVNLPTGKSKMNRNAIMSDDLVEQSRFGDGYNYTPNFTVSHKIGEEDTWSLGVSYAFKQSYEYDRDLPGAMINPGGEWAKSLEWLHAGQKWQALVQLTHSSYGATEENGLHYREGDQTELKLYYNRTLSAKQDLMVYYRYGLGNQTDYDSGFDLADAGGNQYRHYYGMEWKQQLAPARSLRVMFNVMQATGQNYDPLTYLRVGDRSKYGGLIAYDIRLDEKSELSLELEHFYMKDKAPGNSYHGNNFFVKYSRSL